MRLTSVLVVVLLIAGCGGATEPQSTLPPTSTDHSGSGGVPDDGEPFTAGEVVGIKSPRSTSAVSEAALASVVRGDRALGLDLMRQVAGDGNVMVSPYSVATALSMAYAGARGRTASEISDVLHLNVDDASLHSARNALDLALTNPSWEPPEVDDMEDTRDPFVVRPANSAWGQGGYQFLEDYLEILATHYGAGLRLVDFIRRPEEATDLINDWTEEATEGQIPDILPPDVVDELTRLVLVNAIWFQANWVLQFDPEMTRDDAFTLEDGTTVKVPFMTQQGVRLGYVENRQMQAVRLPYTGDAAMVVALPKDGGPRELLASLEPEDLELAWEDRLVDLALPRFEFESDIRLKQALEEVGMPTAFVPPKGGEGADFTGITPDRVLYVKEALHKTFVSVDEHGTEAAAATAVVMQEVSAPMPATLTVDRPFLFWIEHTPTGELLFLGQVANPVPADVGM